jgi:hypothetical protein
MQREPFIRRSFFPFFAILKLESALELGALKLISTDTGSFLHMYRITYSPGTLSHVDYVDR